MKRTLWSLSAIIFGACINLTAFSGIPDTIPSAMADDKFHEGSPSQDTIDFGLATKDMDCLIAFNQFGRRAQDWTRILLRENNKDSMSLSEAKRIDFAVPGDSAFGDDIENEFFNPMSKFAAQAMPQEIINRLTTVPNTRPVFNLRRWHNREQLSSEVPITDITELVIIIPNILPLCLTQAGDGWDEKYFAKSSPKIFPDNHVVAEDGEQHLPNFIDSPSGRLLVYTFFPRIFER